MPKPPKRATVVVATGTVAKLFDMNSDAQGIHLRFDDQWRPGNLADQGPAGKSPPERSAPESMEATFSKILANRLSDMALKGELENLVLIADPETLGEMRPLLHQEVTARLALELDKTLINAPVEDIADAVERGFA